VRTLALFLLIWALPALAAEEPLRLESWGWSQEGPERVRVQGRVINPSTVFSYDEVRLLFEGFDAGGRRVARAVHFLGHFCRGGAGRDFEFSCRAEGPVARARVLLLPQGQPLSD
jgi:hypothetical protein